MVDVDGQVVELLQAKATESVAHVKEALVRYPGIDETTTSELHAQLVAMGMTESARDSGTAQDVLDAKVGAAVHAGSGGLDVADLVPSVLGLAAIALSTCNPWTPMRAARKRRRGRRKRPSSR